MRRFFSTLLVLALLGGTAAAFAVTERLKLVPSPILAPRVDHVFSPTCNCSKRTAEVAFSLRKPDDVRFAIVDADGEVVVEWPDERHSAGEISYRWDGKDAAGAVAADGVYRPRVRLVGQRRTIVLPNPIRVDTRPPVVTVASMSPEVFSPDGDGRSDKVKVRFGLSEQAKPFVFVDDRESVEGRVQTDGGQLEWYGKRRRRPLPPGLYVLSVVAEDLAGNRSAATPSAVVRIRFIALAKTSLRVPAGVRFGVRVSTDARSYRWQLGQRRGRRSGELLVLRAPQRPGRYTLWVSHDRWGDRATVVVEPRG